MAAKKGRYRLNSVLMALPVVVNETTYIRMNTSVLYRALFYFGNFNDGLFSCSAGRVFVLPVVLLPTTPFILNTYILKDYEDV